MAVRGKYASGNLFFRDTVNSPTVGSSMWENFPWTVFYSDPSVITHLDQQFMGTTPASDAIGGWTTTKVTTGAVTLDAVKGLKVDSGAVTATQGVNLQLTRTPFTIAANKPVWIEGKIRFEGQASLKIQFLFGLAAAQSALIATSAVGTDDKVAFDGVVTNGVILSDACTASTAGTGTGFTIANNTAYKLGIFATTTKADFWVNGVIVKSLTANIPTAALAPSLVVQANATVQPICYVDWIRAAGYR